MTKVFLTDDGIADLRKAKAYAKAKWGPAIREKENNAVKAIVAALEINPLHGTVPTELSDLGMGEYRQSLTGYNRVFHYYDQPNDSVYILMVIPQTRDFPTHLARRMVSPPKKSGVPVNITPKVIK